MSGTSHQGKAVFRAVVFTTLAMIAFAANSVICRVALKSGAIAPSDFTAIRIVSGAATLAVILAIRNRAVSRGSGTWTSGFLLFAYAACFSFAYLSLSAATGALILFSFVQATMITLGLVEGDRPRPAEWLGWVTAALGLGYLLLPGVHAPPLVGASLMAAAGVSWGVYSTRGRGATDALGTSCGNFMHAVPFALLVSLVMVRQGHWTAEGVSWAALSGSVTSGLGYVLWYAALPALSSMQAALVQLTAPPLAALGGVLMLAEPLTDRLAWAGAAILGGIAVALVCRAFESQRRTEVGTEGKH